MRYHGQFIFARLAAFGLDAFSFALQPGRFDIGFTSEGGGAVFIPALVPRTLCGQRREMAVALLGRFLGRDRLAHAIENPGAQNIVWA